MTPTSVQAQLLWGMVGGWLPGQAMKRMRGHCALRMAQTCAASMVHRSQAEGCLACPGPPAHQCSVHASGATQLSAAAACRLWSPGRRCRTRH